MFANGNDYSFVKMANTLSFFLIIYVLSMSLWLYHVSRGDYRNDIPYWHQVVTIQNSRSFEIMQLYPFFQSKFSFIAIESHLSASLTLMSISSQFAWIPSNLVQLNDSFRSTFPQIDWFYWGKRVQSLMTFGIFKLLLNNRNWFHYSTWWSSFLFHCYLFQVSTIKLKTLFRGRLFLCTVFPAFFLSSLVGMYAIPSNLES